MTNEPQSDLTIKARQTLRTLMRRLKKVRSETECYSWLWTFNGVLYAFILMGAIRAEHQTSYLVTAVNVLDKVRRYLPFEGDGPAREFLPSLITKVQKRNP